MGPRVPQMPSLVALRSESQRAALSARSQTPVRLPGVASSKSFGAETSNRVLTDHAWTGKAMSTMPTGPFIKGVVCAKSRKSEPGVTPEPMEFAHRPAQVNGETRRPSVESESVTPSWRAPQRSPRAWGSSAGEIGSSRSGLVERAYASPVPASEATLP